MFYYFVLHILIQHPTLLHKSEVIYIKYYMLPNMFSFIIEGRITKLKINLNIHVY